MSSGSGRSPAGDDDEIARLLRSAGERGRPDARVQAEVRAVVEAEWRQLVAEQDRRRRRTVWAAAAGVAVAALGVWLLWPMLAPRPNAVADVARTDGVVEVRVGGDLDWKPLPPGASILTRQELRTAADARAALTLRSGIELRLDHSTRFAFDGADEASLHAGAAYIDAGADARAGAFALRTGAGTIRHVGTQYEARLNGVALRVAIREGNVRIATRGGPVSGSAGEQILLADGRVTRNALAAHDLSWSWVGSVAPAFAIEGRTLFEFLQWAARETGRDLRYATADIEREASRIVLHGSVEGLGPDESIAAVGATTGLNVVVTKGRIDVQPSH
jgi:ferric-dicitrate binding protein FerR (iron transport regulator)